MLDPYDFESSEYAKLPKGHPLRKSEKAKMAAAKERSIASGEYEDGRYIGRIQQATITPTKPVSQAGIDIGGVTGEFEGGVSGDGSIMMKVTNFMDAFNSAKKASRKGPGRSK
jgi:hypothetical protein